MTAFPTINTAFADGVNVTKSDMRDLGNATVERIGELPASYASYTEQAVVCVNSGADGLTVATSADVVSFNGAETKNQQVRGIRATTVAVALTAGAGTLDFDDGQVFDVDVDQNIGSEGLAIANAPADYSEIVVRLLNDGTGGYNIAGGTAVADAFPAANFTFPTAITFPTGANTFVVLAGYRFSSSEKYRMLLVDRDD